MEIQENLRNKAKILNTYSLALEAKNWNDKSRKANRTAVQPNDILTENLMGGALNMSMSVEERKSIVLNFMRSNPNSKFTNQKLIDRPLERSG